MNNLIKNVILLVIALVISYYSAPYLGSVYNTSFPAELNSGWIGSSASLEFIRGISLSLIFFLTLVSTTWIFKKRGSTLWLISPLILWEAMVDIRHIYIPVILALIAFGLSLLLQKIFNIKRESTQ